MPNFKYILITSAYNEEDFIEKTIKSVVSQTVLPTKWIIVDDGSTDETVNIVQPYTKEYSFIELLNIGRDSRRTFSSKVRAINQGFEKVKNLEFEFIGNLDADITFDQSYYQRILNEFKNNIKLGIAGGDRFDLVNGKFIKVSRSPNSVSGAVQLFRRKCYLDIEGYRPLDYGGIDAVAESMARFKGWDVWTFGDIIFYHHRRTGTAANNIHKAKFNSGIRDYLIGYHPLFEILRVISKMKNKPFFSGGAAWLWGYLWASINNYERPVSKDFVRKLRFEQIARLKSFLKSDR